MTLVYPKDSRSCSGRSAIYVVKDIYMIAEPVTVEDRERSTPHRGEIFVANMSIQVPGGFF